MQRKLDITYIIEQRNDHPEGDCEWRPARYENGMPMMFSVRRDGEAAMHNLERHIRIFQHRPLYRLTKVET